MARHVNFIYYVELNNNPYDGGPKEIALTTIVF